MSQIQHLKLQLRERILEFDLELDPQTFVQDYNLLHCLRQDSCCEPEIVHVMERALRPGDFAIDAGAAVGFFSLVMARLVGPSGKVVAVEPGHNNMLKLAANLRLNKLSNVHVQHRPLWSDFADMPFYLAQDSGSNSLQPMEGFKSAPILPTCTLRSLCMDELPRLLKLDIEGAEWNVLEHLWRTSKGTLTPIPYILCELNEPALEKFGKVPENIHGLLHPLGYDMFAIHRDGAFPSLIPAEATLKFTRQNTMVLFASMAGVLELWPEIPL